MLLQPRLAQELSSKSLSVPVNRTRKHEAADGAYARVSGLYGMQWIGCFRAAATPVEDPGRIDGAFQKLKLHNNNNNSSDFRPEGDGSEGSYQ